MGLPSLDDILQRAREISDATGISEEMPVDCLSSRFVPPLPEDIRAMAVNKEMRMAHSLARQAWLEAKAEWKIDALDTLLEAERHWNEAKRLQASAAVQAMDAIFKDARRKAADVQFHVGSPCQKNS